ncbi:MAG: thioredoxin [Verrucomicrobia bacterium]|nr:thioredoxin [Verrucomicrobiota bacterium]
MAEKKNDHFTLLTEENFKAGVSDGLTLVDFYADWCGPCRMLTPVLEDVAKDVAGKAKVAKIDIDQAQRVASNYQVTSIPTLILFKDGKEVGRLVGLRDRDTINEFIQVGAHK